MAESTRREPRQERAVGLRASFLDRASLLAQRPREYTSGELNVQPTKHPSVRARTVECQELLRTSQARRRTLDERNASVPPVRAPAVDSRRFRALLIGMAGVESPSPFRTRLTANLQWLMARRWTGLFWRDRGLSAAACAWAGPAAPPAVYGPGVGGPVLVTPATRLVHYLHCDKCVTEPGAEVWPCSGSGLI